MPTYTSNLNLKKPTPGNHEPFDIDDQNGNMDLIDAKFGALTGSVKENVDSTVNKIGIRLYGATNQVAFDASTMAKIGTWITSHYEQGRWGAVRCSNNGSSNPVFGASEFGLIYCLSSTNYGWGILMTDSGSLTGGILFGQLSAGTWKWYKPTVTQV